MDERACSRPIELHRISEHQEVQKAISFIQEFADLLKTHEAIAPPSTSIIVSVTNSFSSRNIAATATFYAVPARRLIDGFYDLWCPYLTCSTIA